MQKQFLSRAAPRLVLALFLALCAAATPAALAAQETQDTLKLPAEMRTARNALTAGYAALDPAQVKVHFTDSAVVNFADQIYSGREAVDAWIVESLMGLTAVRFGTGSFTIGDNEVVERNTYSVTLTDGSTSEGTSEAVWRKQRDGSWKVVRLNAT